MNVHATQQKQMPGRLSFGEETATACIPSRREIDRALPITRCPGEQKMTTR